MDVVFYNRDHTQRLNAPLEVMVDRYSWNMIGGPQSATLKCEIKTDSWDIIKLLRCPVEIYGDDGRLNWWGLVNRITIPHGTQRIGLGLDEMYNTISVYYDSTGTTDTNGSIATVSDAFSVSEYGTKELLVTESQKNNTAASRIGNLYLTEKQYPTPELEFSGGNDEITIGCYGWYGTLGWKYYSNTSTTGNRNVEHTTQISTIAADSEFIKGTHIEDTAGITSDQYRTGNQNGLTCINQLLQAGTSNSRPLLAYVDKDRYLHVYERDREPPTGTVNYILREDGRLIDKAGSIVPDQHCKVAEWIRLKNVPNFASGLSHMRPLFVESAEYDAEKDITTYTPANAYEKIKLARYVADVISKNSSYSGGGSYSGSLTGGYINPFYLAPPQSIYSTLNVLSQTYTSTNNITSSDVVDIHANTFSSVLPNIGDTKLYDNESGWQMVDDAVADFLVVAYAEIKPGSSTPTTGYFRVTIARKKVGVPVYNYGASQQETFRATGDTDTMELTVSAVTKINGASSPEEFVTRVSNYTDGDLLMSNLNVSFIRLSYLG